MPQSRVSDICPSTFAPGPETERGPGSLRRLPRSVTEALRQADWVGGGAF
jgi:hypothetical protein